MINYLIVGGSSGIGLKITELLQSPGREIIVASRESEKLPENFHARHIRIDAKEEMFTGTMLPESLQGVVYCPGTIKLRPFHCLKDDDFLNDFTVNVMGAVRTIRACLPHLKNSTKGASIVLFSTVAVETGMPYHASIASAKGAVLGLTRSLAAEFAPDIRVNAIAPSLTDTPLAQQFISTDQKRKLAAERHPLKRYGKPEDCAHLAVFLLGKE
ncbi:MAG: SDR family oxidoreductase [Nitrospiraceae bacterium]|nr:MAG: SDR family oxidoreductase [Nitrospiraceae bacterium]